MKILFLASSRSQARQYRDVCISTGLDGVVLNIKHPGLGDLLAAFSWYSQNRNLYSNWISYQLKKNKVRGLKVNGWMHWRYKVALVKALGVVIRLAKKESITHIYLRSGYSYIQQAIVAWAKENDIKAIYTENGQLPCTFVIDSKGVNSKSSIPQSKEFYQSIKVPKDYVYARKLLARRNKVKSDEVQLPASYYFVPFQVPTDSQVLINSPWIDGMPKLYELLVSMLPYLPNGFFFVIKEHPSSEIRFKNLHAKNPKIIFANGNDTQSLIQSSAAVITLNSSVGVEALMLGKKVITLGDAFYNIEGLANHVENEQELARFVAAPNLLIRNEELVSKVFWWLESYYLLPGSLRDFHKSEESLKLFERRLLLIGKEG